MKLKNSNGDETEKNSNCDETQKLKCSWNFKNSNCDESQKLKLWWNSKIQIVMKLKISTYDETKNLNCDDNQKLGMINCITIS